MLDGRPAAAPSRSYSPCLKVSQNRAECCREVAPPYQAQAVERFQLGVLAWGQPDRLRDFPWRHTRDPYRLLISELMLRRTQARQVAHVYTEFCQRWPELPHFLEAETEELTEVLQPLGLQWRIQNILEIRDCLRSLGNVPHSYNELLSLPGVGDYVASAVLCFSQQEARPLIDTNTVRIIGRYFGLRIHQGTRRLKTFRKLSSSLVPQDKTMASAYHYSLLDLAATVCRPVRPFCQRCPLADQCRARQLEGTSLSSPELGT